MNVVNIIIPKQYENPPETVDSHTVSRFYLNKFADSQKRVYVYEKGIAPRAASTKRLTTQKYFYEFNFKGEHTNNRVENFLQKLEDRAAKMYPSLLGRIPLKDAERVAWALFVSSLFLRTKKWREQMVETQIASFTDDLCSDDSIRSMQYDLSLKGEFRQSSEIIEVVKQYAEDVEKQPGYLHLTHLPNSIMKLAAILLSKSWHVIEASPDMQYLASDAPVSSFKLDNRGAIFGGHGFGKPDVVAVLPISPHKIWFASPVGVEWPRIFDENDTALFNRLTVSFAKDNVFARDSRPDLNECVQLELGSTVFGVNAFTTPRG